MNIFTCMLVLLVASVISAKYQNSYEQSETTDTNLGLTEILHMLMKDPKYQALNDQEKHQLFETIYTMVFNHIANNQPENFLFKK